MTTFESLSEQDLAKLGSHIMAHALEEKDFINNDFHKTDNHEVDLVFSDNALDDPAIRKAVDKVAEIKTAKDSNGNLTKTAKVLANVPGVAVTNKKIKITHQLMEDTYKKFRELIGDKKIDSNNVALMVAYSLQLANELANTDKTFKVELALYVIRKTIDDQLPDNDMRKMLHMLVEETVPLLIETISNSKTLFKKFCCCK
jgi:hypothetical protein